MKINTAQFWSLHLTILISLTLFLLIRFFTVRNDNYWFLQWNLLLAFIPLFISFYMYENKKSILIFGSMFGLWLIFYPNAPYVLTDIKHLWIYAPENMVVFDTFLVASFALYSLIVGYISIYLVVESLKRYKFIKVTPLFTLLLHLLVAFGVYIGRFLRFNSWDLFTHPGLFVQYLVSHFTNFGNLAFALIFVLGFGFIVEVGYRAFLLKFKQIYKN